MFRIRANREDGTLARTDVVIDRDDRPVDGIVRFHQALSTMTGRRGIRNDLSRYEAIGMALIDVSQAAAGEVVPNFPPTDSAIHFDQFFTAIYQRYDERYVVSAPLLAERTRRLAWLPDSPAVEASPFADLDYDLRMH